MSKHENRSDRSAIDEQVDRLLMSLERIQFNDYFLYLNNRKRMLVSNFVSGLARGLGMAIGFTVLGAIFIVILSNLAVGNIPLIGDFLADVVRIVQERL